MHDESTIDISENSLHKKGNVLDILLRVRDTKKNIIWATDSYSLRGAGYLPKNQIKKEQIIGKYGKIIQPRATKSRKEQIARTKDKAEVFTPLNVVKEMNTSIDRASDNYPVDDKNWQNYVSEKRLEITCGEAPFIASRYNPTADTGVIIKPHNRVGFLDRKLQVVGKYTKNPETWLKYAEIALKSSYGYEWQGDNVLIARENVLMTIDDFYRDKWKEKDGLNNDQLEYFARIVSWNIWQMDGLKYVKPLSCRRHVVKIDQVPKEQLVLFLPSATIKKIPVLCEGCRTGDALLHTGDYAVIMDWTTNKKVRFIDVVQS